ncbi:unnamed protein product [Cuscuta epithymum]|uniref:Uncharacterized protein n=1 Tax=Cuscuta epithymum TaxID=186058 RepID=A0AAV0FIU5_9ASTE|nr:unnamed protein product [Cuscuta epithymum]
MSIMLKVVGCWDDSHVFSNKRTCGQILHGNSFEFYATNDDISAVCEDTTLLPTPSSSYPDTEDDDVSPEFELLRLGGCQMFQIRRFDSVHICALNFRQGPHRQVTCDIIEELIKSRYVDASTKPYAPNDIIVDMIHTYGIVLPYKKSMECK